MKADYVSWVPTGGKSRAYEFQPAANIATPIAEATGVVLATGKESFSFATGNMRSVLNALKTCNDDLFRTWGIDTSTKVAAEVRGNAGSWFSPDSYPADAIRRGAQGRDIVILTVSADGQPTACHVAVKVDPALDATTCQLAMARGRYQPAPGKSGRYAVLVVRWVLPN